MRRSQMAIARSPCGFRFSPFSSATSAKNLSSALPSGSSGPVNMVYPAEHRCRGDLSTSLLPERHRLAASVWNRTVGTQAQAQMSDACRLRNSCHVPVGPGCVTLRRQRFSAISSAFAPPPPSFEQGRLAGDLSMPSPRIGSGSVFAAHAGTVIARPSRSTRRGHPRTVAGTLSIINRFVG